MVKPCIPGERAWPRHYAHPRFRRAITAVALGIARGLTHMKPDRLPGIARATERDADTTEWIIEPRGSKSSSGRLAVPTPSVSQADERRDEAQAEARGFGDRGDGE